jgi:hypothetical protein
MASSLLTGLLIDPDGTSVAVVCAVVVVSSTSTTDTDAASLLACSAALTRCAASSSDTNLVGGAKAIGCRSASASETGAKRLWAAHEDVPARRCPEAECDRRQGEDVTVEIGQDPEAEERQEQTGKRAVHAEDKASRHRARHETQASALLPRWDRRCAGLMMGPGTASEQGDGPVDAAVQDGRDDIADDLDDQVALVVRRAAVAGLFEHDAVHRKEIVGFWGWPLVACLVGPVALQLIRRFRAGAVRRGGRQTAILPAPTRPYLP